MLLATLFWYFKQRENLILRINQTKIYIPFLIVTAMLFSYSFSFSDYYFFQLLFHCFSSLPSSVALFSFISKRYDGNLVLPSSTERRKTIRKKRQYLRDKIWKKRQTGEKKRWKVRKKEIYNSSNIYFNIIVFYLKTFKTLKNYFHKLCINIFYTATILIFTYIYNTINQTFFIV